MDSNYLHVKAWARGFHDIQCPIRRSDIPRQIGIGSTLMLDALLSDDAVKKRQADELLSQRYGEF